MKQATGKQRESLNDIVDGSERVPLGPDPEAFSYAKELRALGQALEKHQLSNLDLEIEGGIYVVRGKARASKGVELSLTQFIRDLIRGGRGASAVKNSDNEIDLRFSPQQIGQLDCAGRAQRKASHHMPDPYSVSQILRGAGAYIDDRDETSLVGVTLKDRWVTVRYRTAEGRLEQAKQDLEYYYDYWVKMYLRRSNRPRLPPPHQPTLLVSWNGIQKRAK